jgi:hypothetical protein
LYKIQCLSHCREVPDGHRDYFVTS